MNKQCTHGGPRACRIGGTTLLRLISLLWFLTEALPIQGQSTSNPIVIENAKTGNPSSQWDISGAGDPTIQGFATQISVNQGETIHFKINTPASSYRIDIYRLGYYNGLGARLVASILPSANLPQSQPNPVTDSSTGLMDYGNWSESASWPVPATAASGYYIAKLVRGDTGGASHIAFVVRADAGASDILFQSSDTTWQAYNDYGGNSLYSGSPAGRAYKVSYNRPFNTRGDSSYDWLFNAEFPMIRWLEANGYNVSYSTEVDSDLRGSLILQHKLFLSVGHDEYWSGGQRANVEAARDAGVNLGFFSGNEIFWKTRWEPSIDGSATPYRTLVCYKETHANAKIDPTPTWTGTWRDPRFSPPSDGGRPENAVSGQLFMVNGVRTDSIAVPSAYGAHRFWRNTSVASLPTGGTKTFAPGTLGYEWDETVNNGVQPPGLMLLSAATVTGVPLLQDYGSTYASGQATHHLSLYRHSSGALVFGAGSGQWSWGLDGVHDNGSQAPDASIQQATVNLLADMNIQPASLQPGLVAATASTDHTAPTSVIQSPVPGSTFQTGFPVTISGVAGDSGGRVWGVEVSTDGGTTWNSASGQQTWTSMWSPAQTGTFTIQSRAVDDSGNLEVPSAGVAVTVTVGQITIWPGTTPTVPDSGPDAPVELGVKFRSDVAGFITGVRFYKAISNTGSHAGNLWTSGGTLLATGTFQGETASGWQQMNFAMPVPISANTIYVASYHANNGHYSEDDNYFSSQGVDNLPLHALANGVSGGDGVYAYGASSAFPNSTWNSANYWVDVAFETSAPSTASIWPGTAVPGAVDGGADSPVELGVKFQSDVAGTITGLRFYKASTNTGVHIGNLWTSGGVLLATGTFVNESASGWQQINFPKPAVIAANTVYVASYHANTGHYCADQNFFSTKGVDNPPLHALANGVSGSDGVYAYGTSSAFPNLTWNSANYWVDVVLQSGSSGAPPLTIMTTALPGGTVKLPYAGTLAAMGGTPPYNWSITSGVLPPGLTLNAASGAITGTATLTGTFSFTAQLRDSGSPVQTAAMPLNIAIVALPATASLWTTATVPGTVDGGPDSPVEIGVKFRSDVAGTITGLRFYKAPTNTGTHIGNFWTSSGTPLASATFTGETASGWQQVNFTAPVTIAANTVYVASYHANNGHYSDDINYFSGIGVDTPPLHALADGVSGADGIYAYGPTSAFPTQTWFSSNYWVDVIFVPAP